MPALKKPKVAQLIWRPSITLLSNSDSAEEKKIRTSFNWLQKILYYKHLHRFYYIRHSSKQTLKYVIQRQLSDYYLHFTEKEFRHRRIMWLNQGHTAQGHTNDHWQSWAQAMFFPLATWSSTHHHPIWRPPHWAATAAKKKETHYLPQCAWFRSQALGLASSPCITVSP